MKKALAAVCAVGAGLYESVAHAAITLPTLPVTDLESAGTAVLGLVGVSIGIYMVIRMFKRA